MSIVLLSLVASMASAADLDGDGCEDSFFDANEACVAPSATIDASASVDRRASVGTDTALQADTFVGYAATLVGRVSASGPRVVGTGTVIGRFAHIGADHNIGADNTIGRAADVGERLQTQANVAVGSASAIGDDVTLESGVYLGALVGIGDNTQVVTNTVIARSVSIADSTTGATIGGVIGPDVVIGSDNSIDSSVRIRKGATLGNDVTAAAGGRIGRGAIIGDGVTIGLNARIGAGAEVTATTQVPDGIRIRRGTTYDDPSIVDPNPPGTTLIASSAFTDPNPPAGWTQCFGFTNTVDNDISSDAMDGCLPVTSLRLRMWDANGVLVDDQYATSGNNTAITDWPNRSYVTPTPTRPVNGLWVNTAGFFATTNNTDACGHPIGGSSPTLTTGNGNTGSINPGHSNHAYELGQTCVSNSNPYINYTIALYKL